MRARRGPAVSS